MTTTTTTTIFLGCDSIEINLVYVIIDVQNPLDSIESLEEDLEIHKRNSPFSASSRMKNCTQLP